MGEAFAQFVSTRRDIDAMLGIGGGGGTFIVTKGMQSLKVGLPKLMVSTLASGDVGAYVDIADISMMPSVTDFAGLNDISSAVLRNAAFGIVGMAALARRRAPANLRSRLPCSASRPPASPLSPSSSGTVSIVVVFHATGTGGRAMEKLVDSGLVSGVIDVTTTEVCDHLFGGVLSAGADRLGAIARTRRALCGLCRRTRHGQFSGDRDRTGALFTTQSLRHNPQVTLMRTTAEESRQIGGMDRRETQSLQRPCPLPDSRERGIDAGRARPAVS